MTVPTYPYSEYFYAAYAATALIFLAYAASLYRRTRALRDRTRPR